MPTPAARMPIQKRIYHDVPLLPAYLDRHRTGERGKRHIGADALCIRRAK